MTITFCFDKLANDHYGYPNLARFSAEPYTSNWRKFDQHWPYSVPMRLLMYMKYNQIAYNITTISQAQRAWYPVQFAWFDFNCDYIALLEKEVIEKIKKGSIKLLFYYHEGDNPERIKHRLDALIAVHQLPVNSYVFVSANSAASKLNNCFYFPDHEFFFRHINRHQKVIPSVANRSYDFTLLSRTHKWWRATCVSDLKRSGLLDNSLWSYNTTIDISDKFSDNPIEIDTIGIREYLNAFVSNRPYTCDLINSAAQNDHHIINTELYEKSHVHIILETHFDADQSNGTFLTEKTYKAIKYKQPFIVIGPAGSLAQLKQDGYRTFDAIIDASYDSIVDNTPRWLAIKQTIADIKQRGLQEIYNACKDDIEHNYKLFKDRQVYPIVELIKELQWQD